MKTGTTYWLVLSFLSVSFLTKAQSYSVKSADSLFALEEYETAATAYERIYFFSKDKDEKIMALISRSYCFKNLNRNFEAYKGLARISNFEISDSLKCVANYELALNLYLGSYFTDAESSARETQVSRLTQRNIKRRFYCTAWFLMR